MAWCDKCHRITGCDHIDGKLSALQREIDELEASRSRLAGVVDDLMIGAESDTAVILTAADRKGAERLRALERVAEIAEAHRRIEYPPELIAALDDLLAANF